jgi:hypothetical protein
MVLEICRCALCKLEGAQGLRGYHLFTDVRGDVLAEGLHLSGKVSIRYGPHLVGHFDAAGWRQARDGNQQHEQSACGSKVSASPPFPFPPPGASGGHRRLRCAAAWALRRPKAKRFPRSGPERKKASD